jgi:hypothetical protein
MLASLLRLIQSLLVIQSLFAASHRQTLVRQRLHPVYGRMILAAGVVAVAFGGLGVSDAQARQQQEPPSLVIENLDWNDLPTEVSGAWTSHFDRWLTFNGVTNETAEGNSGGTPATHRDAALRITNTSTTDGLDVTNIRIENNTANRAGEPGFALPNGETALTLLPGESYDLDVRFVYAPSNNGQNELVAAQLVFDANDPDAPTTTVELRGAWQVAAERGNEPDLDEIAAAFGFGTTVLGSGESIDNGGRIEVVGEEILSPFWIRADPTEPVYVRQLAAYHTCCASGGGSVFALQPDVTATGTQTFFTHEGIDSQSLLPRLNNVLTSPAQGALTPGTGPFGFRIDGEWSDWTLNTQPNPGDEGHRFRVWPLRQDDGTVIPNVFLMTQDFQGANYDFNDNVYLVANVAPANVNPIVAGGLNDVVLETGGPAVDIDLSSAFADVVDPDASLAYAPTSAFTYTVAANSSPTAVSASVTGATLSLGGTDAGTSTLTIRATDAGGRFAETTVTATATAAFAGCTQYSTLACPDVPVALPVDLAFDGAEGGLAETGFTLTAPPSARLAEDDPVTYPNVPGFEPGLLSLSGGTLAITTTPGIFYRDPSQSSETNSQINALGIAVDAFASPIVLETTLEGLPAPTETGSQQAGLWFGLGESNYVKLVALHTGGGDYRIQSLYESNETAETENQRDTADGLIPGGGDVTLRLVADPAAGTVTGFYSTDGGATFIQVAAALGPHVVDPSFFGGAALPDGRTGLSFAGLFATNRRADALEAYTFSSFRAVADDVPDDPVDQPAFSAQVNFQDALLTPPAGYLVDFGEPFGLRTGPGQGDGTLSYGWVDPSTGAPADLASADNGAGRDRTSTSQSDVRLASLMHMDYPVNSNYPDGRYPRGSWEIAVPNGSYTVTLAVGDPSIGEDPEIHAINVEGVEALYAFAPTGSSGASTRHTTVTVQVGVEDGRLTIDQSGGTNTKLNYVDVTALLPTRPYAFTVSPANRSTEALLDGAISTNLFAPGAGVGVDISTLSGNVHLYPVEPDGSNGPEVLGSVGSSGGNDVIVFTPSAELAPNTEYRFVIDGGPDGVQSEAGDDFLAFSSLYTTGTESEGSTGGDAFTPIGSSVVFEPVDLSLDGIYFSSFQIGPDGRFYGIAIGGQIYRYTINSDGTLSNEEILPGVGASGPRVPIGMVFDEDATAGNLIAWVTHASFAGLGGQSEESDRWGSTVSRLSGPDLAQVDDVFINLPRSAKDHLSNSITYGPDGNLYFLQGSNLAAGSPDNSWGSRPETKLTAAVLTFDEDAVWQEVQASGPIDVMTDEEWPGGSDLRTGTYDPFAPDAPLRVFATGVRNAYDLVWHTNGSLYVPTNGTAAGGNTPNFDPTNPPSGLDCASVRLDGRSAAELPAVDGTIDESFTHEKQRDFIFRVEAGGYYGHPNPSRCEWVLNIGNPSAATDEPGEGQGGSNYPVGTQPDPNYRGYPNVTTGPQGMGGDIWDLEFNKSPNGVIEYRGTNFGGVLQGRVMFVRFSGNDDIYTMQVDAQSGVFLGAQPGSEIAGFDGPTGETYDDPLELIENPATGDIYLAQYDRGGTNQKVYLLRPTDRPDGTEAPILAASDTELIFSTRDNPGSIQSRVVTVSNDGTGTLSVSGAALSGTDAAEFFVSPTSAVLAPGESQAFTVTFDPVDDADASRTLTADLTFTSNGGTRALGLYALSTADFEGGSEPPLADIVATLGYAFDTGWTGLTRSTAAVELGDETYAPLFERADPGAPVTITPVARYSPAETLPFGWYTAEGGAPTLNEVGVLAGGEPAHQTLLPPLASGATTFDPGAAVFGLYTESALFGHVRYTEDARNSIDRAVRIFPLDATAAVDRRGEPTANRYLIGFEDASNGDYQDYVFVVANVVPADLPPALVEVPFRFNAGGEVIDETAFGSFGTDETGLLTGTSEASVASFDVLATLDDDLYLTYRFGASADTGPGADFGYAIPIADGLYTVRLHFVEPFFGVPGGSGTDGLGERVFSVDLEGTRVLEDLDLVATAGPATAVVRTFEGVNVTGGALDLSLTASVNNGIISAVEVLPYSPPLTACDPVSTLPCPDVSVPLPFALSFTGGEGGLSDDGGGATGFTMIDPPSSRLSADGSPSTTDAPGYEPSLLDVTGGQLLITSTAGNAYLQPSGSPGGGPTSGTANSQLNALGAGFDASEPVVIETTIDGLDFALSGGTAFQQAGLWFGLDEDNYVKAVVVNSGPVPALELAVEAKPSDADPLTFASTLGSSSPEIADLATTTLTLSLALDPIAGVAVASYAEAGGALQEFATLSVPAAFFAGRDHDANVVTAPLSFAGIFATQVAAPAPITVAFENFSITPDGAVPVLVTRDYDLDAGWNFIGAAVDFRGAAYTSIFPTVEPGALFRYVPSEGYVGAGDDDSIPVGAAHWLRSSTAAVQAVEGVETTRVEVPVTDGWNGIAAPSCALDRSVLAGDAGLAATPFFAYDGVRYQSASTLEEARGYWVNVETAGTLVLDCSAAAAPAALAQAGPIPGATASALQASVEAFGRLIVQDGAGNAQPLFYGGQLRSADEAALHLLPPVPPAGGFDARFAGDVALVESTEATVQVQAAARPIRLRLDKVPAGSDQPRLVVEEVANGRVVGTQTIDEGGEIEVRNSAVTELRVQGVKALPKTFALLGNYPNPFRDVTTIAFDLPAAATVDLELYNVLGQRVMRHTGLTFTPGARQTYQVDASRLASGLYFYRIHVDMGAGRVMKTGRMTLIK